MAAPIPFGRYVLLDKLAVGGMAELFLAKVMGEAGFEKTCVVKRLLPHLSVHEDFVAMFLDEARLAARLNHPGIVQVFDLGHAQDDYFLAMEYLAGEDLSAVLRQSAQRRRPVPIDVAVRVIARAAEALHFAHEVKGANGRSLALVHRDVSPSNLFITYQGATKVLDFGIARAASQLRQTQAGQIKGKAPYMSPEQISGRTVDRRTDVWALGVCLHELLTGTRLFLGASSREVVSQVLEGAIPLTTERRPEVPAALAEIVRRALLRDPEARFQTAAALQLALEQSGLFGTEPQVSLGEYLSELFGGEQAEARLRRASVWTAPGSGPQPLGTERLGPAESRVAGAGVSTLPAGGPETPAPAPEGLPTVSLRPQGPSAPEQVGRQARSSRRWWIPAVALGIAAVVGGGMRFWPRSASTSAPAPVMAPGNGGSAPSGAASGMLRRPASDALTSKKMASAPDAVPPDDGVPPAASARAPTPAAEPAPALPVAPVSRPRRASSVARLNLTANLPAVAFLDGRRLGPLPLSRARVPAGTHRLRVTATGLEAVHQERMVIAGGASLTREVRFAKGKLNIDAEPWADVWVDGARLGQTPLAGREVWEGTHAVRLTGPAGSKTLSVRVRAGKTTVVNEKLTP